MNIRDDALFPCPFPNQASVRYDLNNDPYPFVRTAPRRYLSDINYVGYRYNNYYLEKFNRSDGVWTRVNVN